MILKNKILKILCASAIAILLPSMTITARAEVTTTSSDSYPIVNLTAEANPANNCVDLNWTTSDAENYSYMIYQKGANDAIFQTIPAKGVVKALQIYPHNPQLVKWVNDYGEGKITCDSVSIESFNSDPSVIWNYDVIIFGFWDSNNSKDISAKGVDTVEAFIKDGRGVLFGHDTLRSYFANFSKLSKYVNLEPSGGPSYTRSNNVKITKKGLLTNYPYNIGDIGTILKIPATHALSQIPHGDIWMRLTNDNQFYLTTWNNAAMIQTGDSNGAATSDEQKIIMNTIYYLAQKTSETSWSDHMGQDLTAPTLPEITDINSTSNSAVTFDVNSSDKGNTYQYYVEATNQKNGEKYISNTATAYLETGIKGYSVVIDQNPSTIPDNTIDSENSKVTLPVDDSFDFSNPIYVHVKAIDNAGNISDTLHYPYDYKAINFPYTVYSGSSDKDLTFSGWKNTINGSVYSGRNVLGYCSELYVNGNIDAASDITTSGWKSEVTNKNTGVEQPKLPQFNDIILNAAGECEESNESINFTSDDVILDKSIKSSGSISFGDSTFSGNCFIIADDNINYNIYQLNKNTDNKLVLYSKNGDIIINGSELEINGILYAPKGNIIFNVNNLKINGRVIADGVQFNGSQVSVTGSDSDWDILIK
ncbi:MAG: hypothetical protein ACI398_09785 [Clostridium sp.]